MIFNKFLRYNGRHHFYWRIAGSHGRTWPQLDPISSVSGGDVRNISFHEPLWLFRLRQRLFAFAGRQRCGRRAESWAGATDEAEPDTWDRGPDGNRTCSYCGSLHLDDFLELVRRCAEGDEAVRIEPSDKRYKIYVNQKGVRNAGEGAIKFYTQHLTTELTQDQQNLYSTAVRISRDRFERELAAMRERWNRERAAS